jgi:hypothetical protein
MKKIDNDELWFSCTALDACREAVQFIAANILRLAAAGADIAGLDSALVTKVAKVRPPLLLLLLLLGYKSVQMMLLHESGCVLGCNIT